MSTVGPCARKRENICLTVPPTIKKRRLYGPVPRRREFDDDVRAVEVSVGKSRVGFTGSVDEVDIAAVARNERLDEIEPTAVRVARGSEMFSRRSSVVPGPSSTRRAHTPRHRVTIRVLMSSSIRLVKR
jgi:hypothetical protein